MATPLLVGLGVAGAAYAAKFGIQAAHKLAANPQAANNMRAAAAGFRAVGDRFSPQALSQHFAFMRGPTAKGFEPAMSRSEAAQILGVSERASKDDIKKAHRKIMLLNHPDRGGSPYIATKINSASELLSSGGRSQSGSAFS